jgi:GT2 family glycosyltransferase/predicted O-methyltransferase YrrM
MNTWLDHRGTISIIVTTYGTDSFYTQACLESIRRWKNAQHELIVVSHDESPLLRAYLDACALSGLIDRLIYAEPNHGHTRSFNLAFSYARGDVVFNICNDIKIGPSLVDDCAWQLRNDPQLGMIGWHWYNEGTFWRNGEIVTYSVREAEEPDLKPEEIEKIVNASWFTGKCFRSIGTKWLQLCNTSFCGIRRELLAQLGGGFGREFAHYWADDFLNYAVLDQGLDIRHFDQQFRRREFFHEFQYDNTDVEDRHRHLDKLVCDDAYLDTIRLIHGGMSEQESILLHFLARAIPERSTVTNVGVWLGSSAIVLLAGLRDQEVHFRFIDCFDLPGISQMSAQPPVTQEQFLRNIAPFVGPRHTVEVIQANTLELDRFPSSDFFFVDAGHTKQCITHDARLVRIALNHGGIAAFHDYGQPSWPDVKPVLDSEYPHIAAFETVGVFRSDELQREAYHWPERTASAVRGQ